MNKTFISKATRLAKQVDVVSQRYFTLNEKFRDLKRECDHRTPDGKLNLKVVCRKRDDVYKECRICGEDVYKDCYGRPVSVYNNLDIPEERKLELEKIMGIVAKRM